MRTYIRTKTFWHQTLRSQVLTWKAFAWKYLKRNAKLSFEQIFGAGVIGCKQQRAAVQLGSCACVRVSARVSGKERERVCVCAYVRQCVWLEWERRERVRGDDLFRHTKNFFFLAASKTFFKRDFFPSVEQSSDFDVRLLLIVVDDDDDDDADVQSFCGRERVGSVPRRKFNAARSFSAVAHWVLFGQIGVNLLQTDGNKNGRGVVVVQGAEGLVRHKQVLGILLCCLLYAPICFTIRQRNLNGLKLQPWQSFGLLFKRRVPHNGPKLL